MKEKELENLNDHVIDYLKNKVMHWDGKPLYTSQVSKYIKSPLYKGCITWDLLSVYHKKFKPPYFMVLNTDSRGGKGIHWINWYVDEDDKTYIYDSFGRNNGFNPDDIFAGSVQMGDVNSLKSKQLLKKARLLGTGDSEQMKQQVDCGIRAIAHTLLYEYLKKKYKNNVFNILDKL